MSYQLNSTANPAHLPQKLAKLAEMLQVASKWLQGFDFSIAMGADYSFYVKSIATCALTFCGYIISVIASVIRDDPQTFHIKNHSIF